MAYYPTDWFQALLTAATTLNPSEIFAAIPASVFFSTNAGVPGATFVSLIRVDSTNKHCYVWDGTQYVKISDYA